MQTYIAILRGINVSGKNKILMADLKEMLGKMKLQNVSTYIQSGNIVFSSEEKCGNNEFQLKLESAIKKKFGFEIPVLVRKADEWKKIVACNPFLKNKKINTEKLHVTFLNTIPEKEKTKAIEQINFSPDEFKIIDSEIFIHCPESYGETKLSNKFFESKLKVNATTRNWKTVNTLLEMSQIP